MYDRLNALGVSMSYCTMLKDVQVVGGHFTDVLAEAAKQGKRIRLIGDNVNFKVKVRQESIDHHNEDYHMFGSAALISEHHFIGMPLVPEIPLCDLSLKNMLPSAAEYEVIKSDCIPMVARVLKTFLPRLSFMADCMPDHLEVERLFKEQTQVVPLPVLPCDEKEYTDVVKILEMYENIAQEIEAAADPKTPGLKIHIGGDQLTRERFTGGKKLRIGNVDPRDRFAHLGTVTFEFFHLGMNYLEKVIINSLWNDAGPLELGTLRGETERVLRKTFKTNVMLAYQADKEFVLSFFNSYLVEALMDFFGMEAENDPPTKNVPPDFDTPEEEKMWVTETLGTFIDMYVFCDLSGIPGNNQTTTVTFIPQAVDVELDDGSKMRIPIAPQRVETVKDLKPDRIKNYGHHVLEVGMTFKYFLELVKTPDRQKLLGLFKLMMVQLKARNSKAKYPLELLRLLLQQYCQLPLQEACEVLQACFVNTQGRINSHIPADLQMEWLVRNVKAHLKHMYSNKTEASIFAMSSALYGVELISNNFDNTAKVLKRAQKRKLKDAERDEVAMIADLHRVRPFSHIEGRAYDQFRTIPSSPTKWLDIHKFNTWFLDHKNDTN